MTASQLSTGAVNTAKYAKYIVPFSIAGFSKLDPKVDVTWSIKNRQEIGIALSGCDLDFAIMACSAADIEMEVHLIGDHPHVIIAPTVEIDCQKHREKNRREKSTTVTQPRWTGSSQRQ